MTHQCTRTPTQQVFNLQLVSRNDLHLRMYTLSYTHTHIGILFTAPPPTLNCEEASVSGSTVTFSCTQSQGATIQCLLDGQAVSNCKAVHSSWSINSFNHIMSFHYPRYIPVQSGLINIICWKSHICSHCTNYRRRSKTDIYFHNL